MNAAKKSITKTMLADLPLKNLIAIKAHDSGLTNSQIAAALGYERPNVIAMLKTGAMRLPLNKVPALAQCLDIDPVFLLRKVLAESSPEVLSALDAVIGKDLITRNEQKLIATLREVSGSSDLDYTEHQDLMRSLVSEVHKVAKHHIAETEADAVRIIDNNKRKVA